MDGGELKDSIAAMHSDKCKCDETQRRQRGQTTLQFSRWCTSYPSIGSFVIDRTHNQKEIYIHVFF